MAQIQHWASLQWPRGDTVIATTMIKSATTLAYHCLPVAALSLCQPDSSFLWLSVVKVNLMNGLVHANAHKASVGKVRHVTETIQYICFKQTAMQYSGIVCFSLLLQTPFSSHNQPACLMVFEHGVHRSNLNWGHSQLLVKPHLTDVFMGSMTPQRQHI